MPQSTTVDPSSRPTGPPAGHSPAHTALAVVFQVRAGVLQVLLWERAREPHRGAWSLPGGTLAPTETLEQSILRHLATKVDVREVAHLEQLGTWSDPARHPERWELATAYLGLVPLGIDPRVPAGHTLARGGRASAHGVRPRRDRARGPRAAPREALVLEHRLRARPRSRSRSPSSATCTRPRSATRSRRRT